MIFAIPSITDHKGLIPVMSPQPITAGAVMLFIIALLMSLFPQTHSVPAHFSALIEPTHSTPSAHITSTGLIKLDYSSNDASFRIAVTPTGDKSIFPNQIECFLYDLLTMISISEIQVKVETIDQLIISQPIDISGFDGFSGHVELRCYLSWIFPIHLPILTPLCSIKVTVSYITIESEKATETLAHHLIELHQPLSDPLRNSLPLSNILTNKFPHVLGPAIDAKFSGLIHPTWTEIDWVPLRNDYQMLQWQFAIDNGNTPAFARGLLDTEITVMRLSFFGEGWFTKNSTGPTHCYLNNLPFRAEIYGNSLEIDLSSGLLDAFFSAELNVAQKGQEYLHLLHVLSVDCERNFPIAMPYSALINTLRKKTIDIVFGERPAQEFIPKPSVGITRIIVNNLLTPTEYLSPTASTSHPVTLKDPSHLRFVPPSAISFKHPHQAFDIVKCTTAFTFTNPGPREFSPVESDIDGDLDSITITLPGNFYPSDEDNMMSFVTLRVSPSADENVKTAFIFPTWRGTTVNGTIAYAQSTFQFHTAQLFSQKGLDNIGPSLSVHVIIEALIIGHYGSNSHITPYSGKQCIFEITHRPHANTLLSTTILAVPLPAAYLHQQTVGKTATLEIAHIKGITKETHQLILTNRVINHSYNEINGNDIRKQRVTLSFPRKFDIINKVLPTAQTTPSRLTHPTVTYSVSSHIYVHELDLGQTDVYGLQIEVEYQSNPLNMNEFYLISARDDIKEAELQNAFLASPWIITTELFIESRDTDRVSRDISVLSHWKDSEKTIRSSFGNLPPHKLPEPPGSKSNSPFMLIFILILTLIGGIIAIILNRDHIHEILKQVKNKTQSQNNDNNSLIHPEGSLNSYSTSNE